MADNLPLPEEFEDFLAAIKEYVNSVERVRNPVMHNRRVPTHARQNYDIAKEPLTEELDKFFASLSEPNT